MSAPAPDDAGARAFEHAAGRVWDAMVALGAAYVVDAKPTDAEEVNAFLGLPEWEALADCPSTTFVMDVFGPIAQAVMPAMLNLAEHAKEVHGDE